MQRLKTLEDENRRFATPILIVPSKSLGFFRSSAKGHACGIMAVMRTLRNLAFVGLTFSALGLNYSSQTEIAEITLDETMRYQTIDAWATNTRYWEEDKENDRFDRSYEPYVEAVSRFLVNEVGINSVRLEIQSGIENPTNNWGRFYAGQIGIWNTRNIVTKRSTTTTIRTS
jgi:hypothetical protein